MDNLADADFGPFKISVVVTRDNVGQLDGFKALADSYGAQLRITRLRPSGRGADSWATLHPTAEQQRSIYSWLLAHGQDVLTGDSFFHLTRLGDPLPGLNLCGAGRVVCLIDPVGDVYACPFVIHDQFKAGNVRDPGGFAAVWRESRPVPLDCASPSPPARVRAAAATTPARAAAWRPSSSPACPSTVPTPDACAMEPSMPSRSSIRSAVPRPAVDHSTSGPAQPQARRDRRLRTAPPRCHAAKAGTMSPAHRPDEGRCGPKRSWGPLPDRPRAGRAPSAPRAFRTRGCPQEPSPAPG